MVRAVELSLLERVTMLEAKIAALEAAGEYSGPTGPDKDRAACTAHSCGYFKHYLAYGGPDLTHESYHAEETQFAAAHARIDRHERECPRCSERNFCSTWDRMIRNTLPIEKRIRA